MSNIAPQSRNNSELRCHRSPFELWHSNLEAQNQSYVLKPSIDLEESQNMEPLSPVSPTSTSSPTASEQAPTPVSPPASPFHAIWGPQRTFMGKSQSRSSTSAIQSPTKQKSTLQCLLVSPKSQKSTQRMVPRSQNLACPTLTRNPTSNFKLELSQSSQMSSRDQDSDRDVVMLSPPLSTLRKMGWEDTTTSPILGRLVGVPLKASYDTLALNIDTSTSGRGQEASDAEHQLRMSTRRDMEGPSSAPNDPHHESSRSWLRSRTISQSRLQKGVDSRDHTSIRSTSTSLPLPRPHLTSHFRSRSHLSTAREPPPPKLHIQTPDPNQTHLTNSIHHLGIPLVPLISVTTGLAHPNFPRSILQYHLLTHDQLDSLARWYHQTIDNQVERFMYPAVIERCWVWEREDVQRAIRSQEVESGTQVREVELTTKRSRFGRFIGLRGCKSPSTTESEEQEDKNDRAREVLEAKMESEWRAALRRAEEEERLQEKVWRGRW